MAIVTCKGGGKVVNGWPEGCTHERTYESAVISTFERNYHDDSDFVAVVWDDEAQDIKNVTYATTRGWTYHNGAEVDASDEVIERAFEVATESARSGAYAALLEDRMRVEHGAQVRVERGRKVPLGTEGKVFWTGPDRYRPREMRIGLVTEDGERHFTAARNVERIDAEEPTEEQVEAVARQRAQSRLRRRCPERV